MPRTTTQSTAGSRLLRLIVVVFLVLIILVGLAVLITWLVVRPRRVSYSVESASVHGFNLTHDKLTAYFDFTLKANNPSRRVSIYYDSMEVYVLYDDQTLAFSEVNPFHQPHRNAKWINVQPTAKTVPLLSSVSSKLRRDKNTKDIGLEITVKARIRFKVGVWKSRRRTLKAKCYPVFVHIGSSPHFNKVHCDVDD